jgi:hypothetical protein
MEDAPFSIGERVNPDQLLTWSYAGLSGKPGRDERAVRRFSKGDWMMEVSAHANPRASTRVVSIRTLAEDSAYWAQKRRHLLVTGLKRDR